MLHTAPPPTLALIGPTASGKTACALALAARLPIEIISVDSALVFRDMDIGTAKPSAAERAQCPHHLIDLIAPHERYSAAQFRLDALQLIEAVRQRGRIPLLVGGTMLYLLALRDGLSELPAADPELRAEIDRAAAARGWPALHAELAALDADAAAQLAPHDAQRIQRALEIVRLSGRSLAANYAQREDSTAPLALHTLCLEASDRSVLHARIAQRFDAMIDAGLIDEVRSLQARYPLHPALPSMRCVGYRQAWEHLAGAYDVAEMRNRGIYATRQLAKRQLTWQRKFCAQWDHIESFDCLDPTLAQRLWQRCCAVLQC